MARHTHRQAARRKKVYQDSPFLCLPGEIRELIYLAALSRPEPIELCPREFMTFPVLADATARTSLRLAKFRKADPRSWVNPFFRDQRDLEYIRKEMATGLLATCRQVCNEARAIFWSTNVWRFSGDCEWRIFRRWLASIGPQAMAQLKHVEVCLPIDRPWAWDGLEGMEIAAYRTKNEPKLHMSKIPREGVRLTENVDHVSLLLQPLKGKLKIKFLAPSEFDLILEREDMPGLYVPDELRACTERTLVVEKGAAIWGEEIPKKVAEEWEMDVVLEEGCFWRQHFDARDEDLVSERKEWSNLVTEKWTFLGVQELLEEKEKELFSIPARGGKVNKSSGRKGVARRLKGFGGCRFVNRERGECLSCGVRAPYVEGKWKLRSIGWSMHDPCASCRSLAGQEKVSVVEIKKKARAVRMGLLEST